MSSFQSANFHYEDMGPMTIDELVFHLPPPVEPERSEIPDEPTIQIRNVDEVWCDHCGLIGFDTTILNCDLCGAIWPVAQVPQQEPHVTNIPIPSANPSMFLRQLSMPTRMEVTDEDRKYNAAYYKCLHFNNINLRYTPLVYIDAGNYYFNNPVTGFVEIIDQTRYEEFGGMN